jgi:hypothetical protein
MIILHDYLVCFDCDGTLVKPAKPGDDGAIPIYFDDDHDDKAWWIPNETVIQQVREHLARRHMVFIWSRGGANWAEAVMEAVGLGDVRDRLIVMRKPDRFLDDEPLSQFEKNWEIV